jgi:hypothetical protein
MHIVRICTTGNVFEPDSTAVQNGGSGAAGGKGSAEVVVGAPARPSGPRDVKSELGQLSAQRLGS